MSKKKIFEKKLSNIVKKLIKEYKPEKIILFGSLARGEEDPHDADLLIIKDDVPHYGVDRIRQVSSLFRHTIGVDTLVYKPQEFNELAKVDPFIKSVLKEGKVLYG